jgi:tyrosyl-tRNA synthetase
LDEVTKLITSAKAGETNPRDVKRRLAREIVGLYHGAEAAQTADDYFIQTFSQKQQPIDAEEAPIPADCIVDGFVNLPALIVGLGFAKSNGAVKDLIKAGAVSIDGEKVTELRLAPDVVKGKVLKVGKHQFRKIV